MPLQSKALRVGGAGAACTSPLDNPEESMFSCRWERSCDIQAPIALLWYLYFLGSALRSRDAEEQEQRNCRQRVRKLRVLHWDRSAWEAENLWCEWVALFWDTLSSHYHFLPLVVLLHLFSGRNGELGHRAGSPC